MTDKAAADAESMTVETSQRAPGLDTPAPASRDVLRAIIALRVFAIAAGLAWSIAFIAIGLRHDLVLYGDGSIFSYAVAVQDAWAFHWHNISGRMTVYLYAMAPAEFFVALTGDARGGVTLYGLLFFAAPLLGLLATFFADRSNRRVIFSYACFSTALLCPLVFGFPTEMWMAHALLWPTLAVCHFARDTRAAAALIFVLLLALTFTHAGALIFGFAIVATLWLRGASGTAFRRAGGAYLAVLALRIIVKATLPPDDYIAAVLANAARHVFDVAILEGDLILLIAAALAAYGAIFLLVRRLPNSPVIAALPVALALAAYWYGFDHALHTQNRYVLRTIVLIAAPVFGMLAAAYVIGTDHRLNRAVLFRLMDAHKRGAAVAAGAFALVMLIHAVETTKFIAAWTGYRDAVRGLATGSASDPPLGDARFVSAARIAERANRMAWSSTTPYLSVLLAPNLLPARLVVDPRANYFWLSCQTATANLEAARAVPREARALIRTLACLHR